MKNGDREYYKMWEITYICPPIPVRNHDYQATHFDYDGPEDGRCFTGPSVESLKAEIDEWELDSE